MAMDCPREPFQKWWVDKNPNLHDIHQRVLNSNSYPNITSSQTLASDLDFDFINAFRASQLLDAVQSHHLLTLGTTLTMFKHGQGQNVTRCS